MITYSNASSEFGLKEKDVRMALQVMIAFCNMNGNSVMAAKTKVRLLELEKALDKGEIN